MAAGSPYPTTGSSFSRDRLKVRTIILKFIVDGPRADGGDEPYDQLDSFAPTAPLGLIEVGRTAGKEENGDWALAITFEGITESDAVGAVLEYDNASVDSPIESFEKFAILAKENSAIFDPTTKQFLGWNPLYKNGGDDADKSAQNPFYGTTHFIEATPILRVTFLLKEFSTDLLRNLCKIDTPQIPKGTEKAVQTPEGKTWLKKSVKARFRGNVWEIEVEYWLAKWLTQIYAATD